MIGTEFLKGQGLGNQLFCYVSSRCIALDRNCEFGTAGQEQFAYNIHNQKGMYFMDIDLGIPISKEEMSDFSKYNEKEEKIYVPNSVHDMVNGCYIAGADQCLKKIPNRTLIYGNLQSEEYFNGYVNEIKKWLQVKEEYENYDFCSEDICILNMRGGEYVHNKELYLKKSYWTMAMIQMKKINPDMKFIIVTEDVESANKMFPDLPAYHFDICKDYVTIKNAQYLIVSNSSFAFFPAITSDTLKYLIAPKYWARHNLSDGYWASEQNIYTNWNYLDRDGNLFTADQCRQELKLYKNSDLFRKKLNPYGKVRRYFIIALLRVKQAVNVTLSSLNS